MKHWKPVTVASLISSLLGAPLSTVTADEPEKKSPKPHLLKRTLPRRMRVVAELPDDPALPALVALRTACLNGVFSVPGHRGVSVDLQMHGYTPGSRATLEARAGDDRLAVKFYEEDPAPEVALYEALASAGLASGSGVRAPRLVAWDRDLRIMVISWLEGPTAQQLVKSGRGARAGELAARWLRRQASLSVNLGPPFGAERRLWQAGKWVKTLQAADPTLGSAAVGLRRTLMRTQPKEDNIRLVHGTLYDRHILDLGDGSGVIDWQRFGQGPIELDAGMFLATIWRLGFRHESLAAEAARAEQAFLAGTAGLLDPRALAWHRAVALLRFANKLTRAPGRVGWLIRAHALLAEGSRLAQIAG